MDGQSVTTKTSAATSSTRVTRFSQISRTSNGSSSLCSEPGTMNQLHFRQHKRGWALNQNQWKAANPHDATGLKDGIPSAGFPDCERLVTSFVDAYGESKMG